MHSAAEWEEMGVPWGSVSSISLLCQTTKVKGKGLQEKEKSRRFHLWASTLFYKVVRESD